ncbi:AAA+-type ATPase [Cladophialophora chaetospira]|uniref:AAA+-type ATPase n=1 Tax=Cladophialophora chaetospira TaxID=386627 RepID=A0AA39CIJ4_9EURO|nr:AAA+-type ATPase [Cladophialophora chaetospira]
MSSFTVRPAGTDKDPFRVGLTAVTMLSLKLKSGDICDIRTGADANSKRKLAIAWEGLGPGLKDTIVQTSKLLQEAYGFKLGDKITISRSSRAIDEAGRVTVRKSDAPALDHRDIRFWTQNLASVIPPAGDYLVISQTIRARNALEFVVKDVGLPDMMIARVTPNTAFRIINDDSPEGAGAIELKPVRLGGIQTQVDQLQGIVNKIMRPLARQYWSRYEPVQGVLLYGNGGTGKTALIESLADAGWSSVIAWKPGTQYVPSAEPCLIIVEDGEDLARKLAVRELDLLFKRMLRSPTLVIAEVRHPNDIDARLRREGKFSEEIELPIPSAPQRKDILLALRGPEPNPTDEQIQYLSERTHGYVGVDLARLIRVVIDMVPTEPPSYGEKVAPAAVESTNLETALKQVRPSALQEIFLETPNVKWSDIGGQHEIKRQLHNAIERPLKHADRMKYYGVKPKKGVLLYGPPGCSKTLLVRALATEAGLNFLAVKGAELISMYVGESERATREVFRKARQASPSIIFFDEIDAIASRGRSGSDLHVLTTLLVEMDGFEELRNVFVVAATNKPQQIDPALMRPGRFDNVVYIGPPDLETRTEILQKRLSGMHYQTSSGISFDEDIAEFAALTNGFSGAEVVAICEAAGERGLEIERGYISRDDVKEAIRSTPKSITKEMLEEFETWNAARMAR